MAPGGAASPYARVSAKLQHLVSYEHMGRVALRCVQRCKCRPQRIDAHRVSQTYRNDSVYTYHEWAMRGAYEDCVVRLHVLRGTSSGEHKFKVRHIILNALPDDGPPQHNASMLRGKRKGKGKFTGDGLLDLVTGRISS